MGSDEWIHATVKRAFESGLSLFHSCPREEGVSSPPEGTAFKQRNWAHPAGVLILDFPASRTVRDKPLLFIKYLVSDTL
jgi:hypothetical protein